MSANLQILNVPISNDGKTVRNVVIYAPLPLTESEWAAFHRVLRKMKPGLVSPDNPQTTESESE